MENQTPAQVTSADSELSRQHAFVRSTLRHHGILEVHTALVADLIHGLENLAQQRSPRLESVEQRQMQMAGIVSAALGYWKKGEAINPDYWTVALDDVAELYEKYEVLRKASRPAG